MFFTAFSSQAVSISRQNRIKANTLQSEIPCPFSAEQGIFMSLKETEAELNTYI